MLYKYKKLLKYVKMIKNSQNVFNDHKLKRFEISKNHFKKQLKFSQKP